MEVHTVALEQPPLSAATATLVFVRRYSSGASRRMESLVAWVKVTQKRRLRVVELDADRHSDLVGAARCHDGAVARRGEGSPRGRASSRERHPGRQIEELIRPYLQPQ